MNNKGKGFVFVETIVVIVVLTVGLVMVYSSFSAVASNDKRRATFDDVAYIYRTYYIENFLLSLNIDDYIDYFLPLNEVGEVGKKRIQQFNCNNPLLYKIDSNNYNMSTQLTADNRNKMIYCENILRELNVENIYITEYNVNELKHCTTRYGKTLSSNDCNNKFAETLNTISPDSIYYIRTLNGKSEENPSNPQCSKEYRVIVEYKDESYELMDDTMTNVGERTHLCPDGYEENNGSCYKKITRHYYANVKMILKRCLKGD